LANKEGLKVAVIVNDMAELNVDAFLVHNADVLRADEKMVELTNGCICCTLREDLLSSIASLAAEACFDHIVIESSGISEPLPVAETFSFEDESGTSLGSVAELANLVTVVDASAFLRELNTVETLKTRGWEADSQDERCVAHLLIDQVEFADVLVLNKTDLVSQLDLDRVRGVLRHCNPGAECFETNFGKVKSSSLFHTARFSMSKASDNPKWLAEARVGEHLSETVEYGISSFTFRAIRPFHPARLAKAASNMELQKGAFEGLLRVKGIAWLATQMDLKAMVSLAGHRLSVEPGSVWWAAVPRKDWPDGLSDDIKPLWHDYGDRGVELVCIGERMYQAAVEDELRACLLTDLEFANAGAWPTLGPDPYTDEWAKQFTPEGDHIHNHSHS